MKIAFLQFGAGGDCIWATPILHKIRQLYPNDNITWIIFDQYRSFIKGNPDLDSYIAWPLKPGIPRQVQERERWEEIKEYAYNNFDHVIISQHWPDHESQWDNNTEDTITDYMIKWANECDSKIGPLDSIEERKTVFKYSERDKIRALKFLEENGLKQKDYICITPHAVTVGNDVSPEDYWLITKYWNKDKVVYFGSEKDKPLEFGKNALGCSFGMMAALAEMSCGAIGLESGPGYIFASIYSLPLVILRNAKISPQSGVPLHKQGLIKTKHRTEKIMEVVVDNKTNIDGMFKDIIIFLAKENGRND